MPDGVHLNAFLYLPANQQTKAKIPGVINTLPYRYQPGSDSYFARNGYASILVDVRGTGGSEGIPLDEYSPTEYEDTTHVIDWLSKQPWCNGNIGMYGLSYGAFNSVYEAAALKPPALKAICAFSGTDCRYTDDIHCPGGTMLMIDQAWALGMVSSNVMPGAPAFNLDSYASLDRWNATPWIDIFLRHQRYGPHWAYGSLAPDYARLTTPALLAGGYLDIYQNFVPRIMKHSPAVTKGILGPWSHSLREPGPKIDWSALQVRWFDHWLKGFDTGILREPRVSFYVPGWRRESLLFSGEIPGEWRHLNEWPETAFTPTDRLYLRPDPELPEAEVLRQETAGQGGRLSELSGPASALRLRYAPGRGGSDQSFFPAGGYYGLDSRDEDVYGLAFDTEPLREPLEILGFTRARLFVSSTAQVANWIARLSDVAPDGTSYLVSRGYLNGTHRRSHTHPEPLQSGEVYEIVLEMWCVAHRFEPGHRVRLVVTNAEFPVIWPSPYPMTTTLYTGGNRASFVDLPGLPQLQYLSSSLPRSTAASSPDKLPTYRLTRDFTSGVHSVSLDLGDQRIRCDVKDDDPATASLQFSASEKGSSPDSSRQIETRAEGTLRGTVDYFILDINCTLFENGKVMRSRHWRDQVRRTFV
ncbi:MAG TPA: CocE/NonD family hydrolase [Terriglobia bacterium]|nr:CocE/NonD family hydrolase [Terriglobia bacterium]